MGSNNSIVHKKKYKAALVAGLAAGLVAGFAKIGWEALFPPRTPERDALNPPVKLLDQLGLSQDTIHFSYTFSETERPIMIFLVHFGFSIFFAVLYSLWIERNAVVKRWGGAVYGTAVFVLFHEILLPIMGTVPPPWEQPAAEHLSELFGHIVWIWIIEIVRRDITSRLTKTNTLQWQIVP